MTSSPLRVASFSKINLALAVLCRRADQFHEIRTVFQTIDIHDELEFQPDTGLSFECWDLADVPRESNLVWKAAQILSQKTAVSKGVRILLRKRIPAGAGLGGGSGNAAATLLGLCRFWQIAVPSDGLYGMAAELGSDVPFFLQGGTALGVGKGEDVYPLPDLAPANLVVIHPGIHISTADAYRSLNLVLTSRQAAHKIQAFCGQLINGSRCPAEIFNDFETSILPAYPAIQEVKDFLMERGATAALLSGSGSSVFGFFKNEESALAASCGLKRENWRAFPAKTLSRFDYFHRMFG